MKQRKQSIQTAFCLLLSVTMLMPLNVCAGATLEKEKSFVTDSDSETVFEREAGFEEEIKEDGIPYKLENITYEILNTTYLDKKNIVIDTEVWETDEFTPAETITEDGIEYILTEVIEEEGETSTDYEVYKSKVSEADVPTTKTISVVNPETQETEQVTAYLTGITQEGTTTEKNQMYITFIGYDADYYIWNGHQIPRNDSVPALSGYEAELLKEAGAASGSYVTSIAWSGNVYTNADGVQCRNAVAQIERKVPLYHANYSVTKTLYQCTYEAEDVEGSAEYEVKAIAHYQQSGLSTTQYVLTSIGILLLIVLVVVIIMVLAKRKKKKEGQV